jgi:uncharacterized membrane protein
MRRGRLLLLAGTCFVAALTVATASVAAPQGVRIALGVLMVLVLPGFALVCAVLPERQLSSDECLLASVGMSLAMVTCVPVLLAATPIGLSRGSLAVVLDGSTIILSTYAGFRTRFWSDKRRSRQSASEGSHTLSGLPPAISRERLR